MKYRACLICRQDVSLASSYVIERAGHQSKGRRVCYDCIDKLWAWRSNTRDNGSGGDVPEQARVTATPVQ